MTNWRLLEAELERALEAQSIQIDTDNGDKQACCCNCDAWNLNVTMLAQTLADRVELKAKPVQVKAIERVIS